jgi:uncharacterized coiled-coil DUF342 family protein
MHEFHLESQKNHEKMLHLYKKSNEEQEKADQLHSKYVENIEAAKILNEELEVLTIELSQLREELKIFDTQVKNRRHTKLKAKAEVMRKEAMKKLEAGTKLTFEEMRLIYENNDRKEDTE